LARGGRRAWVEGVSEEWILQIAHAPRITSERTEMRPKKKSFSGDFSKLVSFLSLRPLENIYGRIRKSNGEWKQPAKCASFIWSFAKARNTKTKNLPKIIDGRCSCVFYLGVGLRRAGVCTTLAACFHFWAWPDRRSK